MGKKSKIGKQRRDKYYYLAKELGYRSRAAFKLIQLNKRFEFLQRSRAIVDLCAAPGGWLQVSAQNMPVSSICIGIDLVPIKSVNRCITLQGDITAESTRKMIQKELQSWKADCVLHDGAPNMGLNWTHDAFQQNCLTLSALKIATHILMKNGCFVTKIFRSKDYHELVKVFQKLFKKVHVWKPPASRLESAEIFVVCEKYYMPDKVDPDLLDSRKVFLQSLSEMKSSNPQLLFRANKKGKNRAKVEGYDDGILLFKSVTATEFIKAKDYLEMLGVYNQIILDDERWENNEATTEEIQCCIKDLKVCGPKELQTILKWRKKLLKELLAETTELHSIEQNEQSTMDKHPDEIEEDRLALVDEQIATARSMDKAAIKKKRRKELKEKAKLHLRKKLNMNEGISNFSIPEEQDLFSLAKIAKLKKEIKNAQSSTPAGDGSERMVTEQKQSNEINDKYGDSDSTQYASSDGSDGIPAEDLIHTEDHYLTKEEGISMRTSEWFSQEGIVEFDYEDDEDEAIGSIEHFLRTKVRSKSEQKETTSDSIEKKPLCESEAISLFKETPDVEDGKESNDSSGATRSAFLTGSGDNHDEEPPKKLCKLTPEMLALGEQLIYSSKTRRDLEDWAWNKYTNNDENLPAWFVEDEKKHYRKELPVTKEQVQRYKDRMKELNAQPIKKVAEAKARKKRRQMVRLAKSRKKAEGVVNNENMEHNEKVRELKKLYRKGLSKEKKNVSYQVMTKGKLGRVSRPSGIYKVVDARLKKDKRKMKSRSGKINSKKSGKMNSRKSVSIHKSRKAKRKQV